MCFTRLLGRSINIYRTFLDFFKVKKWEAGDFAFDSLSYRISWADWHPDARVGSVFHWSMWWERPPAPGSCLPAGVFLVVIHYPTVCLGTWQSCGAHHDPTTHLICHVKILKHEREKEKESVLQNSWHAGSVGREQRISARVPRLMLYMWDLT